MSFSREINVTSVVTDEINETVRITICNRKKIDSTPTDDIKNACDILSDKMEQILDRLDLIDDRLDSLERCHKKIKASHKTLGDKKYAKSVPSVIQSGRVTELKSSKKKKSVPTNTMVSLRCDTCNVLRAYSKDDIHYSKSANAASYRCKNCVSLNGIFDADIKFNWT